MSMYSPRRHPRVIAHRGGALLAPENSWEALEKCAELGLSYVETDAHLTADGEVVLIHDPILDRVCDASGLVSNHTWSDLREVRITGSSRGLIRFSDALAAFPDTVFNVDAKSESVAIPLVDVIRNARALNRVCVASFDSRRLRRMRAHEPGLYTSLGQAEIASLVVAAQFTVSPNRVRIPGPSEGIAAVQVPLIHKRIPVVTRRFVATAHAYGLPVHVWTLNERDEMVEALNLGVDAIITDEPVLAREVINEFVIARYGSQ
ncbi:MAG: glycerophosphodiester phosphodiesterase [Actinomycetaceae bacterium]|nr:glycerophosphodiester phosphodiesterase [Actinomycetaceae bacterium]